MLTIKRIPGPGQKELEVMLHGLEGKIAKVGWFANARYPQATEHGPSIGPHVATVAAIQEYGSPAQNIPPRPFMRPTIVHKRKEWAALAEAGVKAVIRGNKSIGDVMEGIGQQAAGDVRETITKIFSPALAEATVLARIRRHSKLSQVSGRLSNKQVGGITKPLVDTGILLGTCTFSVENE